MSRQLCQTRNIVTANQNKGNTTRRLRGLKPYLKCSKCWETREIKLTGVHSAGFLDQLTDQSHSKVKNKAKYKHLVDYFYLKTILAEFSVIIVYEFSR